MSSSSIYPPMLPVTPLYIRGPGFKEGMDNIFVLDERKAFTTSGTFIAERQHNHPQAQADVAGHQTRPIS